MLRGVWGWPGYVVGDAGAIKFVQTDHEWALSQADAAADALKAGADLALGGGYNPQVGALSFAALLNATGRPVLIENCHGPPFPTWPNDTTPGKGGECGPSEKMPVLAATLGER